MHACSGCSYVTNDIDFAPSHLPGELRELVGRGGIRAGREYQPTVWTGTS